MGEYLGFEVGDSTAAPTLGTYPSFSVARSLALQCHPSQDLPFVAAELITQAQPGPLTGNGHVGREREIREDKSALLLLCLQARCRSMKQFY